MEYSQYQNLDIRSQDFRLTTLKTMSTNTSFADGVTLADLRKWDQQVEADRNAKEAASLQARQAQLMQDLEWQDVLILGNDPANTVKIGGINQFTFKPENKTPPELIELRRRHIYDTVIQLSNKVASAEFNTLVSETVERFKTEHPQEVPQTPLDNEYMLRVYLCIGCTTTTEDDITQITPDTFRKHLIYKLTDRFMHLVRPLLPSAQFYSFKFGVSPITASQADQMYTSLSGSPNSPLSPELYELLQSGSTHPFQLQSLRVDTRHVAARGQRPEESERPTTDLDR